MLPRTRLLTTALLALLTLTLATCISARQRDFVRYDDAKDEFHMLMLLEDIRVREKDDLELLEATYRNRDHLIAPGIPGGANMFIPFAGMSFIRTADKQLSVLTLFATRPTEFETTDVAVPLDTIKINPGTFFVEQNKLGFYQSFTVPGKTVDIALAEIGKALQNDDLNTMLQTELDRREKGGKIAAWADLKTQFLKDMGFKTATTAPAATTEDASLQPQMALEQESLTRLKAAITAKSLKIERNKQMLKLVLPVTAKDAAAFADLYKALITRTEELIRSPEAALAANADDARSMRSFVATLQPVTLAPDNQGLAASVDLLAFTKSIEAVSTHPVDMNDKSETPAAPPDPIAYLKGKGITLSDTITADQIIKDFNAGTLKSYPSETPVKPGAGIIAPK